jgi:hypothetical protein
MRQEQPKDNRGKALIDTLEKTLLVKMYVSEKLSVRQIGRAIGVHHESVRRYLVKYGIKRRSIREARVGRPHYMSFRPSCKEETKRKIGNGNRGKRRSQEYKESRRVLSLGAENPNWKGGIAREKNPRNTAEYKLWRLAVMERDLFTCQECGQKGGHLHAHHINKFKDYPALRFVVSNGRTLCLVCHGREHGRTFRVAKSA